MSVFTDGFLGYQTSFMLDFVVCALVLVVPLLTYSLWLVKVKRNFAAHKRMQILLAAILCAAVAAFEIDLQWVQGGWENIVAKSYSDDAAFQAQIAKSEPYLWTHLVFAISTPALWLTTLVLALRRFPDPPVPERHSRLHKVLGWVSTIDVLLTAVTGWAFYYVTFVAVNY